MENVSIDTIEWKAPEYTQVEHSVDWFWAIGLITLVAAGLAVWQSNYLFAVFIFISGACLVLFNMRTPQEVNFVIETGGFTINNIKHSWNNIAGFNVKDGSPYSKILVKTSKKFIPVYTVLIPSDLVPYVKENLVKVTPNIELEESHSIRFVEKLGF
jgi:hypothetical protein